MIKFKVGDRVRIKSREELGLEPGERPSSWNTDGYMDYLFGSVQTVVEVEQNRFLIRNTNEDSYKDSYLETWSIRNSDAEMACELSPGDMFISEDGYHGFFIGALDCKGTRLYLHTDVFKDKDDAKESFERFLAGSMFPTCMVSEEEWLRMGNTKVGDVREMTVAEVSEKLGFEVKIVK